ncbi:MAG: hypothetical protein ACOCTQ_00305 [Planctomycetota bacterium]
MSITTGGSDPDGEVAQVTFYRETSEDDTLEFGEDKIVGVAGLSENGWLVEHSTEQWSPVAGWGASLRRAGISVWGVAGRQFPCP